MRWRECASGARRDDRAASRYNAVGAAWPVAPDILLSPAQIDGLAAEWSLAPGADPSRALLFFHGGGYCSGSIVSHRRMATEAGRAARARTLAVAYRRVRRMVDLGLLACVKERKVYRGKTERYYLCAVEELRYTFNKGTFSYHMSPAIYPNDLG